MALLFLILPEVLQSALSGQVRKEGRSERGFHQVKAVGGAVNFLNAKRLKKSGRKQLVIEIVSYMVVVEGMSTLVFGLGGMNVYEQRPSQFHF